MKLGGEMAQVRKGLIKYSQNPFLEGLKIQTTKKQVTIKGKGDRYGIINYSTGETQSVAGAGFYETKDVDRTQFVKIFSEGVTNLLGLSSAGMKVFRLLYSELLDNPTKDRILLDYNTLSAKYGNIKISNTTYFRGLNELLKHNFIAQSEIYCLYYVNPAYLFNGDRIQMIKEYRWKDHPNQIAERKQCELKQDGQGDLFNQDIEVEVSKD